ncbi:hypothetical protein GCM10009743_37240 [Kribbella swartbergensis]
MADYECYPLWESQDGLNNVDPFDLPIPGELANALTEWSDQYTATLNRSDPRSSGFTDTASAEAWLRAGAVLASQLRDHGLNIDYFHAGQAPSDLVVLG